MKHIFLLIFMLLQEVALSAPNLDSLNEELKQASSERAKIKILIEIGTHLSHKLDSSSFKYLNQAEKIAHNESLPESLITIYNSLSNIYWYRGNFEQSLKYKLKLIDLYKPDSKDYYMTLSTIGLTYSALHKDSLAYSHYATAYENLVRLHDTVSLGYVMTYIGNHFRKKHDFNSALKWFKNGFDMIQKFSPEHHTSMKRWINGMIFHTYIDMDSIDKALSYYPTEPELTSIAHTNMTLLCDYALLYNKLGDRSKSIKADFYYKKAVNFGKEALIFGDTTNALPIYENIYSELVHAYDKLEYYDSAFVVQKKLYEVKQRIINLDNQKEINLLSAEFEDKLKIEKINLLETENERNKFVLFTLVFVLGITLVFTSIYIKQYRAKKKAYNKLAENEEQLSIALNTKNKFFSIISHDLRGPVSSISNLTDLISKNFNQIEPSKMKSYLDRLSITTNNVYEMLTNLLLWAKTQTNALQPVNERIENEKLIKDIVNEFDVTLTERRINIQYQIMIKSCIADKQMITTIIRNLLSNAIKFSLDTAQILIGCEQNEKNIVFFVYDEGTGIASDIENFASKNENKTSALVSLTGSGLGLQIAKELAQLQNGKIWYENNSQKGVTFYFSIPDYQ